MSSVAASCCRACPHAASSLHTTMSRATAEQLSSSIEVLRRFYFAADNRMPVFPQKQHHMAAFIRAVPAVALHADFPGKGRIYRIRGSGVAWPSVVTVCEEELRHVGGLRKSGEGAHRVTRLTMICSSVICSGSWLVNRFSGKRTG